MMVVVIVVSQKYHHHKYAMKKSINIKNIEYNMKLSVSYNERTTHIRSNITKKEE